MTDHVDDRGAVRIILGELAHIAGAADEFPTATSVVFRLELPPQDDITLEFLDGRTEPLSLRGAHLALYWVDSDPLALPEKPYAWFAFDGGSLQAWQRTSLPVVVGGRRLPSVRHDSSLQTPVGNAPGYFRRLRAWDEELLRQEIDAAPRLPPESLTELPPLTYPLPPTDVPGGQPITDQPGTTGDGPVSVGSDGNPCKPVNFVTCLLLQGKPEGGKDALGDEAKALVDAFAQHGYTAAGTDADKKVIRAKDAARPVEKMLEDLLELVPKEMCKCPSDQFVLIVAGHEGANRDDKMHTANPNHDVSYAIEPLDGDKLVWVTHADFAKALAAALKGRNIDPAKLRLVIFGCYSGDALASGRYGKYVPGALVVTSAPDRKTGSFTGAFSAIVKNCLGNPTVKTWADLVKCLKFRAGKTLIPPNGTPTPPPAAGRPKD